MRNAVPAVEFREIAASRPGEPSSAIRERVICARKIQQNRFAGRPRVNCNARMGSREMKAGRVLDDSTLELLKMAMQELKLSARAYDRILKVSRTIADLATAETITADHVSEAIQFRGRDP